MMAEIREWRVVVIVRDEDREYARERLKTQLGDNEDFEVVEHPVSGRAVSKLPQFQPPTREEIAQIQKDWEEIEKMTRVLIENWNGVHTNESGGRQRSLAAALYRAGYRKGGEPDG